MKTSVIIPTLNEEKHIVDLLQNLMSQSKQPFEIIVVDGGSTDETKELFSETVGIIVCETSKPVGNQRQVGGEKANGDLLIFLDADTNVQKDFISEAEQIFQKEKLDIGCPRYVPNPPTFGMRVFYLLFNSMFYLLQWLKPSGAGSCIVVRNSVFQSSGGFDKSYVFDDIEFISRAGKNRKFRIMPLSVSVSTRRIVSLGFLRSLVLYLRLSYYFATNQFKKANAVSYPFGGF